MLTSFVFFLLIRRPPRSTRTDTLFPYTTLFRSGFYPGTAICGVARYWPFFSPARKPDAERGAWSTMACSSASPNRSEEHTSELQSLMRSSYAVFCLKTKTYRESTIHTLHVVIRPYTTTHTLRIK